MVDLKYYPNSSLRMLHGQLHVLLLTSYYTPPFLDSNHNAQEDNVYVLIDVEPVQLLLLLELVLPPLLVLVVVAPAYLLEPQDLVLLTQGVVECHHLPLPLLLHCLPLVLEPLHDLHVCSPLTHCLAESPVTKDLCLLSPFQESTWEIH